MGALEIPPELKKITPYVRRAEELDKDKSNPESRLVAYYARQYAVHIGIPNSKKGGDAAKKCLGILLGELEREKPIMDNFTREESKFLCRKFALNVFNMADGEDRMGLANKNTAKTFYAAASFLEILAQFYPDDDESAEREEEKERIVYAKWKATDILKAIKEGRQPTAGGYGEQQDDEEQQEGNNQEESENMNGVNSNSKSKFVVVDAAADDEDGKIDLLPPPFPSMSQSVKIDEREEEGYEVEQGPPPAYPGEASDTVYAVGNDEGKSREDDFKTSPLRFQPPPPVIPPKPASSQPPRPPIKPVPSPTANSVQSPVTRPSTVSSFFGLGGGKKAETEVTKAQLKDAIELTRFALSALEDKDLELGVSRLQQALQCLGR